MSYVTGAFQTILRVKDNEERMKLILAAYTIPPEMKILTRMLTSSLFKEMLTKFVFFFKFPCCSFLYNKVT